MFHFVALLYMPMVSADSRAFSFYHLEHILYNPHRHLGHYNQPSHLLNLFRLCEQTTREGRLHLRCSVSSLESHKLYTGFAHSHR